MNKDVTELSSVRIVSIARAVAYPDTPEKLVSLISELDKNGIPFVVVGRMSNVLFKDRCYDGVLIKTTEIKNKIRAEEQIEVLCGNTVTDITHCAAEVDLGGFEGLFGIPGTIGGMIRQNAGAFSYEISERFINATCYLVRERSLRKFTKDEMRFAYRESVLKDKNIILLGATLSFLPKERDEIYAEIREYAKRRRDSQPIELPSLGSTFKRCNGLSAGYYIDAAGLKGYSIGGAQVSVKHAGFIVNQGGATAEDYIKLIHCIKSKVYAAFGVELEEEIEIIG